MIRILLLLATLILPIAASAAPAGIPLWEDARTGMRPGEVLRAFPEAARVAPEEQGQPRRPAAGKVLAHIPRVRIAGEPYRARFHFFEDGLVRVVLELPRAEGMPFSRGLKLTEQVREALTEKYGEPVNKTTGGQGYKVDWKDGRTAIHLVVITQSYKVKKFEIIYEAVSEE